MILLRNLGVLLMAWALLTGLLNPFLENLYWRRVSLGLMAAGSLLFTVALSL